MRNIHVKLDEKYLRLVSLISELKKLLDFRDEAKKTKSFLDDEIFSLKTKLEEVLKMISKEKRK